MSNAEYPRWVYPPDGGPGCIVQTPEDKPKGWLDTPSEGGPATGERIIGQPTWPRPEQPIAPLPPDFPRPTPLPDEGEDDSARKSKKK